MAYADVYPGISLTYYGNQQQLEYDFTVVPGTDPSRIRLGFAGADSLAVDSQGDLEVQAGGQVLRQQAPVLYQDIDGVRRQVAGHFVVEEQTVGFAVGAYDARRPLVIDPVLTYSTYLGGIGSNQGSGIAVDAAGNAYVTGGTTSTDFPTANAFQLTKGGNVLAYNAFVTKFSADGGSLVYSTYLGGSGGDGGSSIAVDADGNAYLTGSTGSTDFPTANAFQPTNASPYGNAFVAKLSADGATLVYSSYLGGSGYNYGYSDFGISIALDAGGSAYVTGDTWSTDFPTVNAFQAAKGGPSYTSNAFVAKLSADGFSLLYSTYLGGSGDGTELGEYGWGIAVDGTGSAYVTGSTPSTDFPTANAFQPTKRGFDNAFVTKLTTDGGSLVYSTYLGGSFADYAYDIAVDTAGNAYLTGTTASTDFPTAHAFQPIKAGPIYNYNAFVTKLAADGASLVYSSYLGGSGYYNLVNYGDTGWGIAVDAAGNAYLTGETYSTNFPTANAFQATKGGNVGTTNAFVTKVSADGGSLVYSSYLGGSGYYSYGDGGNGIAVDAAGSAYVTGTTSSTDFPTANAFQPTKGGGYDAFVTKIGD